MKLWGRSLALTSLLLLGTGPAFSEEPATTVPIVPVQANRVAYLEQRVRDLREYRDFLEDQVAAAKAVIAEQRAQLATCQAAPPTGQKKD